MKSPKKAKNRGAEKETLLMRETMAMDRRIAKMALRHLKERERRIDRAIRDAQKWLFG